MPNERVFNPDTSRYLAQFHIESTSRVGQYYTVSFTRNEEWQCSCLGWTRHVPRQDCRHIRAARQMRGAPFADVAATRTQLESAIAESRRHLSTTVTDTFIRRLQDVRFYHCNVCNWCGFNPEAGEHQSGTRHSMWDSTSEVERAIEWWESAITHERPGLSLRGSIVEPEQRQRQSTVRPQVDFTDPSNVTIADAQCRHGDGRALVPVGKKWVRCAACQQTIPAEAAR